MQVTSLKVIRNKQTGFSEGYGFVEFLSHAAAEKVLQSYGCMVMPNTEQHFRLNWATFSMGEKRANNGSDLSIFVGDLAADVTDTLLLDTFSSKYPSVKAAKVVIDANTGRSKGYGFVRFGDDNERSQAMTEMNGVYCSSRPMRIGAATPRKSSGYQMQHGAQELHLDLIFSVSRLMTQILLKLILTFKNGCGRGYVNGSPARGSQSDGDSTNTTDEDLRQPFLQYGEVVSVKIPVGKGCGFVQFANRNDAEEALEKLKGLVIGKQTVRLSWGRIQRTDRSDFVSRGLVHIMGDTSMMAMVTLSKCPMTRTCTLLQRRMVLIQCMGPPATSKLNAGLHGSFERGLAIVLLYLDSRIATNRAM
nr:polyadenylate-binding protein RBP47-like [Ipomoea batatas]